MLKVGDDGLGWRFGQLGSKESWKIWFYSEQEWNRLKGLNQLLD